MLAHNVYFALKDNSEPAIQKMVAACKKSLATHPGIVFFACGTLQKDLARPVNDREHWAKVRVFDSEVASA